LGTNVVWETSVEMAKTDTDARSALSNSAQAKIFISLVVVLGWMELIYGLFQWRWDPAGFLVYLVVVCLLSGWKVELPGVTATLPVNFVFALIGIVSLHLPEVLAAICSAVLVQHLRQSTKKAHVVQLLFDIAGASIAITASYQIFHSTRLRSLPLETPVLLAVLGCTYFAITTLLAASYVAVTEDNSIRQAWRKFYLWAFPFSLLAAATAGLFEVAKQHLGLQTSLLVVPVAALVYGSYRKYLGRLEEEKKHANETAAIHLRTIESLALAIEAKDHTTHDHLQRVQTYAVEIAKELNLAGSELEALRAASLLHDIGKLAVPEHIVCKPGKLTPEEFEKMKVHPVVGAEILARAHFPYPVVPIVRSHHEKWDGSGYPDGLKGTEIPIGARILSVVDCLDALASDRQYRRALPLGKAMEMVAEQAGVSFDPDVVRILQRRYIELEQKARGIQAESLSLSMDVKIERGAAPAAGFEQAADSGSLSAVPTADWGALLEVLETLPGLLAPREVFALFTSRLQELIPSDSLAVYMRCDDTLIPQLACGAHAEFLSSMKISLGEGLPGWVAANGRPILNGHPSVNAGEKTGLRSALAVPLEGEQEIAGVLALYRTQADAFSPADLQRLMSLGPLLGQVVESSRNLSQRGRNNVVPIASQAAPRPRGLRPEMVTV
jgi:putative nucleotidyltransferase with HDIG domain